jgi:hypothetical protein
MILCNLRRLTNEAYDWSIPVEEIRRNINNYTLNILWKDQSLTDITLHIRIIAKKPKVLEVWAWNHSTGEDTHLRDFAWRY